MTNEQKDAIDFMLALSRQLLNPSRPVHKNLDPTFYHTLTYEGDVELIKTFNEYEELLKKYMNE